MFLLGLIDVPLWLILILVTVVSLYWYGTWNHSYWRKRGIPGPKTVPFLGLPSAMLTASFYTIDAENMAKFGKVFGFFMGNKAELMVGDEDMITEILIKQFHNFTDRRPPIFIDKVFNNNLLSMTGDRWRQSRAKMSPAFTTGRLKKMGTELNRNAKSLVEKLKSLKEFDAKIHVERYTMDCIAATAFGIRLDSQTDENSEFSRNGRAFIDYNIKSFKLILLAMGPSWLLNLGIMLGFNMNFFDEASQNYFVSVVNQALEGRAKGENRVDFLQLMVDAKKGMQIHDDENQKGKTIDYSDLSDEEMVSSACFFFLAGFDTVSIAMTLLLYSLACNQHCQEKLIEELDRVVGDQDEITHEMMAKCQYLEQCLNETLRIYPPSFRTERLTVSDSMVCGMEIEKGTLIHIPILAIHRDPHIWPDPMKFDPERFSPENKAKIKPTHWMPFGMGPRICIGMRLALFEIKLGVAEILKNHRLVTCEKTEIPLTMANEKIMKGVNGTWIALEPRT